MMRSLLRFTFLHLGLCDSFTTLPTRPVDQRASRSEPLHSLSAIWDAHGDVSDGMDRRKFLHGFQSFAPLSLVAFDILPAAAEVDETQRSVLECRLLDNLLTPPPYGMESPDVFYPTFFEGKWKVQSKTTDVQAPCGISLFGGNQTYASARMEVGKSLDYECRFLQFKKSKENAVVADREFNVKSIARASMGPNSVLDIPTSTPNKLTCILSPIGSPSVLQVDLLILKRLQEHQRSSTSFSCSEVARQIVAPVGKSSIAPASLLKEVETISLYDYDPEKDVISCIQRSATFLLPSQENPTALRMWQAAQGRPVDVRFYDVTYTRR